MLGTIYGVEIVMNKKITYFFLFKKQDAPVSSLTLLTMLEIAYDFDMVNFLFSDGDDPCSTSYGVYIFQLI